MPPNVVLARLKPDSGKWASKLGQCTATSLATRPFLALHLPSTDYFYTPFPSTYLSLDRLFVISPNKPEGIYSGFYCALSPAQEKETRVISVYPPIHTDGRPLYVHTAPFLNDFRKLEDPISCPLPYHLDYTSFVVFCYAVYEDLMELRRRHDDFVAGSRSSGGPEAVRDDWDTWSGVPRDGRKVRWLRDEGGLFEHMMPICAVSVMETPSIYSEMRLLQQLEADYSWQGIKSVSEWVIDLRSSIANRQFHPMVPSRALTPTCSHDVDIPADAQRAINILETTNIPYDGQPRAKIVPSSGWWDEPCPDFDVAEQPRSCPRVQAGAFRVVVFDLIGTLIDRDTAILEAINCLSPKARVSRHEALRLFVDCESGRTRDSPGACPVDIMRRSLRDVALRLHCLTDDCILNDALTALRRPVLYEDARSGLDLLRSKAAELLALPLPDTLFSTLPSLPPGVDILETAVAPLNGVYSQMSDRCEIILNHSRTIHPTMDASEILLIAASAFRAIEPARNAGFQSALITRPQGLTSTVRMDTAPPTYSADNLDYLSRVLDYRLEDTQPWAIDLDFWPPYRIRGVWQCDGVLGEGSFGTVYSAYHLFTNEEVAIKVDMPDEELQLPCALPYEEKIYRVLRGYLGILEPHWCGEEGGASVMIMDKLGPNLDQLRRFCRGTFSLKTVCLLALQMLNRIEFVHSRGIVIRDIKPSNFAMGKKEHRNVLFLFDFGVSKLCVNPMTGKHIPFRTGRRHIGTARYSSYNSNLGHELGHRDDIEAFGTTLLFLLHGKLPWQGIYAPSTDAKFKRIGEMKAGDAMGNLLAQSPPEFTALFEHSRSLSFEHKPDYDLVRGLFLRRMQQEKWENDGLFDWVDPRFLKRGTLLPEEYLWDQEVAFDTSKHIAMAWT